MTVHDKIPLIVSLTLLTTITLITPARASELDDVKAAMKVMQENMAQMQKKIAQLEHEKQKPKSAAATATTTTSVASAPVSDSGVNGSPGDVSDFVTIAPTAVTVRAHASEIRPRDALNNQQEPAPRPNDLTLDPQYRGFIPIPNTQVLIKFNAKPRLDFTDDPNNTGNPDRFVTAQIPVEGDFFKGGGNQFNANARGSQLSVDVRAPEIPGSPRFYYQNDFFGSGGGELPFRVRQLYGEIYNFVVGQTFSVFEDPDAWPDTVDYEGPNSAVFARRPLVRYQWEMNKHWQMNFGLEKPGAEVDTSIDSDARSVNHAPDGGFNIRYEDAAIGHVQFAAIFRDIGVKGPSVGDQTTFGWGLNLAGSFNLTKMDSVQAQLTYGEGIFRYFNDDFANNDAAFNQSGELTAIPAFGGMIGYTHKWTDYLRSTVSYGYVHLDNETSQGPNAYHQTHYGSFNVVWQMRKRLSLGLEGLYGQREVQSGAKGDAFRIQLGLVYSLFD
ncbi:MAG: DcaP family trimeric outer membrane transporter [Chthoniobacterales bacterium]